MSHSVEILSVGTELLLGNIANLDAQILSQGLSELGLNVFWHTVVGDNPQRAKEAVAIAKRRADIIITTGGLGPTCDDLTKNVLAEAFGKELIFHEECAQRIRTYFQRIGREMTDNNLQQAMLPEGCTVLDNDWGTAPGLRLLRRGGPRHHAPRSPQRVPAHVPVPGPALSPVPVRGGHRLPHHQALRHRGVHHGGPAAGADERHVQPHPGPLRQGGECELRVTAKAATDEAAQALLRPTVEEMKQLFGRKVYGVDVPSLEYVVLEGLKAQGLTIGVAESCTGGLMAKRLTDIPGASQAFQGGIVSYTNEVKAKVLGVPQELLDRHGAVSAPVALAMAQGARQVLGCDIALSSTGVAGPDRDDRGNEVGTMFVAIATPRDTFVRPLHLGSRPVRERLRIQTASHAFDLARRYLAGLPYGKQT